MSTRYHTPHRLPAHTGKGFTIVELLIVIIVLGILAALVYSSFWIVQQKAKNIAIQNDLNEVEKSIKIYYTENGTYPVTTPNPKSNWRAADVLTDENCTNGSSQTDWIPDYDGTPPQSDPSVTVGVDGVKGCYLYVSNGTDYVISAWNLISPPQTEVFYRRLGFREFQSDSSSQFYTCNDSSVGGVSGGSYSITQDYYKHSYTVSNIMNCNETPPSGGS